MLELDTQEKAIIRQLISNPRASDNQISKSENIPVKTVNRKRKMLEKEGLLHYFACVNHTESGTGTLPTRKLYVIELDYGITKDDLLIKLNSFGNKELLRKHVNLIAIAEKDGNMVLVVLLEAERSSKIIDVFNSMIVPELKNLLSEKCIKDVMVLPVLEEFLLFHNYKNGKAIDLGNIFVI